jgi:hypothetical protein
MLSVPEPQRPSKREGPYSNPRVASRGKPRISLETMRQNISKMNEVIDGIKN